MLIKIVEEITPHRKTSIFHILTWTTMEISTLINYIWIKWERVLNLK